MDSRIHRELSGRSPTEQDEGNHEALFQREAECSPKSGILRAHRLSISYLLLHQVNDVPTVDGASQSDLVSDDN